MSALTDLFTALANKIRSKTGGSDTYTPLEMVSDGIDDVYAAGEAAGTTTHTQTYTPSADTAANDMGVEHEYRYVNTSGMITPTGNKAITANGTGIDVSSYATASVAVPDPTLDGDAAVGNVLSGKTFYNNSTIKRTGSMTNNGAVSQALNCGGSYTVPEGYHNGSGTVTANSLSSQTGVDSGKTAIDASHVHSGYQGWVNGNKVSGSYTEPTITSITPTLGGSEIPMGANNNYQPTVNCFAVKDVEALTPSNSSPDQLTTGRIYNAQNGGYAIASYQSKTPDTSGVAFDSGFVKMSQGGYAYSSKPTGGFSETTLWTNSSPTSNFAAQTVTLNQTMTTDKFDYIKVVIRLSTTDSTENTFLFPISDVLSYGSGSTDGKRGCVGCRSGSIYVRTISKASASQLSFTTAAQTGGTGTSNAKTIPVSISGLKFTP